MNNDILFRKPKGESVTAAVEKRIRRQRMLAIM